MEEIRNEAMVEETTEVVVEETKKVGFFGKFANGIKKNKKAIAVGAGCLAVGGLIVGLITGSKAINDEEFEETDDANVVDTEFEEVTE